MKVLMLSQCVVCHKVFNAKWIYDGKLIDIIIDKDIHGKTIEAFGITISHGYCDECYARWQDDFEKGGG